MNPQDILSIVDETTLGEKTIDGLLEVDPTPDLTKAMAEMRSR